MTSQERVIESEAEKQQEHRRKIELIFAQACADALRDTAENLLYLNDNDERQRAAEAHGAAFASAFVLMSRYFTALETHPKPQQRSDSASCSE